MSCSESSAVSGSVKLVGLWILTIHKKWSSRTHKLKRIPFTCQAIPQTRDPTTASRMKWFAVAIMAVKISIGYDIPSIDMLMRFQYATRGPVSGNVAMVNPINNEYPKCNEGIAAIKDKLVITCLSWARAWQKKKRRSHSPY